jgi:hypothetical protein
LNKDNPADPKRGDLSVLSSIKGDDSRGEPEGLLEIAIASGVISSVF